MTMVHLSGFKEFQEFASAYEFEPLTSPPRYPQSNGKVENAVKIPQSILKKTRDASSDPNLSLLDYRNTPAEGVGVFFPVIVWSED